MKKPTLRRFGLGLLQQLMAMGIMIAIAGILFNSFLTVESMSGTKTYRIDPFHTERIFEDSEVYQEIFRTAVSDITRLVMIKSEVETNGSFDPHKEVDVSEFANRRGVGNGCAVTAVYELEDLIKWGRDGVEYNNRVMSMEDFLNYFGPAISEENFALDENGQIYFRGFYTGRTDAVERGTVAEPEETRTEEEIDAVAQALDEYTQNQLLDMAFSYVMAEYPDDIILSREDDGSLNVYFPLLVCRYETVDGERQLLSYAENWVDYMKLQRNLVTAIENLAVEYEQYQTCSELYREGGSNLKYMVRMTADGQTRTYTNVSELLEQPDSAVTEYFSEYRRYLIYYPDSLEFTGNTVLSEDEIHQYIREYDYAYPETTHIWIGVDNTYAARGDAFYNAHEAFERLVPNIGVIVTAIVLQGFIWAGLWLYLSATAGIGEDEEGDRIKYLNGIDHIWTEVWAAFGALIWYGMRWGYGELLQIADSVYAVHSQTQAGRIALLYEYGSFGLYGMTVSTVFCLIWYSLVRRLRSRNLWKDSFVHKVFLCCRNFVHFVFRHRSSAVSTLLPYNLFLFANFAAIFCVYVMKEYRLASFILILATVIFDVIIGMLLFRNNGEQIEIVDGINRIRDGEVDFKLDADRLHGANREMADAVNNIGEGIRKAVRTSMKDERMKTDLITNVSHDIKTPLTSIINYVDLLKRLKIEAEPAKSYIDILESKAQRLKQLTDDLVEASKISSGNIVLNNEKLDLTELLNQSVGEFSQKFEEKRLHIVFSGEEQTAGIYADSRRMWRVIENLFNNICKYAMEGTRVYIDQIVKNGRIRVEIKNISESRMNISPEELTERFIRGDESRSDEGSGLGLSIAKSLVRLQGGEFEILLDGDLFKVVIDFPEYVEEQGQLGEQEEAETP